MDRPQNPADLTPIPEGNAGVEVSIQTMLRLAREDDPAVWDLAHRIVPSAARGRGPAAQWAKAAALHQFLIDRMEYVADAEDIEQVRSPGWIAQQIEHYGTGRGDCDDYVTFAAALCRAVGLRCRMRVVSQTPSGEYDHVYLKIEIAPGQWIASDAIHRQPFGWEIDSRDVSASAEFAV